MFGDVQLLVPLLHHTEYFQGLAQAQAMPGGGQLASQNCRVITQFRTTEHFAKMEMVDSLGSCE